MSSSQIRNKLMVVDDDPSIREYVSVVGELMDRSVLMASCMEEAMLLIKERASELELLLIDYYMPGPPLKTYLPELGKILNPNTKVVLITAAVNPSLIARDLGMEKWLAKPFSIDDVKSVIAF